MRMLMSIVVIVVVFFLSMTLYVALTQSKYVYHPDRELASTPASVNLDFEDVSVETEDGATLHAWYVPCREVAKRLNLTLLFCHGNAGDMGDRVGSLVTFNRLGFDTLIFDYRGYGKSTGKPGEEGTYLDALACWDYLVNEREVRASRIVVFGRSLGGAIASWLAARAAPAALVLESVFSSALDMAHMMFPYLPARLICRFRYDNVNTVAEVDCPVLVAHGRDDRVCPFPHGRQVFEAAPAPKQFVELQGGHNDGGLDANPDYQQCLVAFLEQYVKREP